MTKEYRLKPAGSIKPAGGFQRLQKIVEISVDTPILLG
jgi:hypothetical protein